MGKALGEIGSRSAARYAMGQWQQVLQRWTLVPPQLRVALLRAYGARIGRGSLVHPVSFSNLYRTGFRGLRLGRDCFVGEECFIDLAERIVLGDQVTLAARVMLLTHRNVGYRDHPLQPVYPPLAAPIEVGAGSFLGARAVVLAGTRIGTRCLVAAGAVVHEDVPDGAVVAGVPAKIVEGREGAPGAPPPPGSASPDRPAEEA